MTSELREALDAVARRFRSVRLWGLLAAASLAWAAIGLVLAFSIASTTEGTLPEGLLLGTFLSLTAGTAIVCGLFAVRSARDPRWVARRIEAKHPELNSGLLAALEVALTRSEGGLGFLQSVVVRLALGVHLGTPTAGTRPSPRGRSRGPGSPRSFPSSPSPAFQLCSSARRGPGLSPSPR